MTGASTLRASDRDREQIASRLADHLAVGRLGLAEFEDRVGAAYAAVTIGELDRLVTDLPAIPAGTEPDPMTMPLCSVHRWFSWLVTGLICLAVWVAVSASQGRLLDFWPIWVIGPWGAVLLAGALTGRHRRSGAVGGSGRGCSAPRRPAAR